jgi:hypothetical protein
VSTVAKGAISLVREAGRLFRLAMTKSNVFDRDFRVDLLILKDLSIKYTPWGIRNIFLRNPAAASG